MTDPIGAVHPINADLEAEYYQQRGFGPGRPTTPDPLRAALTGDSDDLMQLLASEGDPRFADTAGRAYIRIRTLQAALAAAPTYSEADRQAAYKAGWDDARAVIADKP